MDSYHFFLAKNPKIKFEPIWVKKNLCPSTSSATARQTTLKRTMQNNSPWCTSTIEFTDSDKDDDDDHQRWAKKPRTLATSKTTWHVAIPSNSFFAALLWNTSHHMQLSAQCKIMARILHEKHRGTSSRHTAAAKNLLIACISVACKWYGREHCRSENCFLTERFVDDKTIVSTIWTCMERVLGNDNNITKRPDIGVLEQKVQQVHVTNKRNKTTQHIASCEATILSLNNWNVTKIAVQAERFVLLFSEISNHSKS
jgi:hypothetical protein